MECISRIQWKLRPRVSNNSLCCGWLYCQDSQAGVSTGTMPTRKTMLPSCFKSWRTLGLRWVYDTKKKKKKKKKKLGLNYWLSYFQVETGSTAMVFPMDIDIISTWDSTVSEKRQNKMIRLWMGVLSAGKRRREFLLLMSMETRPSLVWCCKRITASNKNIIVG